QPSGVESHDLPASIAVGSPFEPQPGGEPAAELLLVDGAGSLRPLVDRRGVEGGEASVGAPAEVGHDRVGVELRVALPAGAVDEGGGGDARRKSPAFAVDHLA